MEAKKGKVKILNKTMTFRLNEPQQLKLEKLRQTNMVNLSEVFRRCLDKAITEIETKK